MQQRTPPRLTKKPNDRGFYEIRWSEVEMGRMRSKRLSTRTGDLAEAERKLADFIMSGPAVRRGRTGMPTVAEIADAYLEQWSAARGNDATDRAALRAPLGAFGPVMADRITDEAVTAYTQKRMAGGYASPDSSRRGPVSASTVRRELTALQAALNWAAGRGMIPGSVSYRLPKPAATGGVRDRWLTEDDERILMDALPKAPEAVRLFTLLALTYGARMGAIMDLTVGPMIDFRAGSINFHRPGQRVTRKRRPVVPMTKPIRQLLELACLGKPAGTRILPATTPAAFEKWVKGLGYGWVTPHVLKHTAITLMLRAGANPADVSKATNTDLRTIFSVYRHHSQDEILTVVERRRAP